MPVSDHAGAVVDADRLSDLDPAGHPQGGENGSAFDTWTSGIIIIGYAIPAFLFAVLLMVLFAGGSYRQIFPLRGLTSDNFETCQPLGKASDYLWHHAAGDRDLDLQLCDADAADQEQLSGRNQQAIRRDRRARA